MNDHELLDRKEKELDNLFDDKISAQNRVWMMQSDCSYSPSDVDLVKCEILDIEQLESALEDEIEALRRKIG